MARSLNKAMLIGRMADEPSLRNLPSGSRVCNFTVVTGGDRNNRRRNNNSYNNDNGQQREFDDTVWHRIVAWNQLADIITTYLHKGSNVFIEGRIQSRTYVDKDGIRRYVTEIIAESLTMLDRRSDAARDQFEERNPPPEFYAEHQNADKYGGYVEPPANNAGRNSYQQGPSGYQGYAQNSYNNAPERHEGVPVREMAAPAVPSPVNAYGQNMSQPLGQNLKPNDRGHMSVPIPAQAAMQEPMQGNVDTANMNDEDDDIPF